jgi:hypothetical protein
MTDIDDDPTILYERTYFVTFRANKKLETMSNIRSITLAATTTDAEDAQALAYSDLVEEFGYEVAAYFNHVTTEVRE